MAEEHSLRISVKAVIVRDDHLLLIGYDLNDGFDFHYNLPGGGVKSGEGLHQALKREVWEEASVDIEVEKLLLVTEYVPAHHDNRYGLVQSLQLFFQCTLRPGSKPEQPASPIDEQEGVYWLPLSELHSAPLLPNIGRQIQAAYYNGSPAANPFIAEW